MGNKMDMISSLNNLGSLFRKKKDYAKALDCEKQSAELLKTSADPKGKVENHSIVGLVYFDMGKFSEAIIEFEKAWETAKELGDKKLETEQLAYLGKANYADKKIDRAMEYYDLAFKISAEIGSLDDQRIASEGLYTIYKLKNDIGKALFYHEKLTELKDSVFNASKNTAFNNLKTQFALDRQEHELKTKSQAELQVKEEEKKRQRLINYIIIVVLLIVSVFSYFLYQRFKLTNVQKKIIEQQKAMVDQKNKAVTDSIHYAERIQKAHLPQEKYILKKMKELKDKSI
jgi:tetratricopeptide (TPR) repeat protein